MTAIRPAGVARSCARVLVALTLVFAGVLGGQQTPAHATKTAACMAEATKPATQPSWGQQRMGAEGAWSRTRGDVTVAVIDSGVSAQAPALSGRVLPGTDLRAGAGDGDCFGRGTFIASLIAGAVVGDSPVQGIAPGAVIYPVRVTDDPNDFTIKEQLPALIAAGIRAAVDAGAKVIAIGLTTDRDTPELREAVAHALGAGVVIVASAERPQKDSFAFPAAIPGVMAVAPLAPDKPVATNELGAEAVVAAPSDKLLGSAPTGSGNASADDGVLAIGYAAGAVALVRADAPSLTPEQVIARIVDTADYPVRTQADSARAIGVVNPVAAVSRLAGGDLQPAPAAPVVVSVDPAPDTRLLYLVLGGVGVLLLIVLLIIGPLTAIAAHKRPAGTKHAVATAQRPLPARDVATAKRRASLGGLAPSHSAPVAEGTASRGTAATELSPPGEEGKPIDTEATALVPPAVAAPRVGGSA